MVNQALHRLLAAGLSVIPTREDKRPAVPSWTAFQARQPTPEESGSWAAAHGLGVICGAVSGGIFCIDIDQKNDVPGGRLVLDFAELVKAQAPDLLDRLVVEKTPSGGFHMVGRCAKIIPNLKLARNEKREVLIETRGEGGYFCAAPTPDYTLMRGTFEAVPEVTSEELDLLLSCARALNREGREAARPRHEGGGTSPGDAYDARATGGELVALLESHGWKVAFRRGEAVYLRRPDKKDRGISATWNHIPGRFYVFTTSTAFEPEHVYKPYAVYAVLEHDGDFSAAARALAGKGYGDRPQAKPTATEPAPKAAAEVGDMAARLRHLYDNGMRKGCGPGWEGLGKIYQVVKGQLNIITGIPSHGKSEFADALMVNMAVNYGWRWIIYSPENHPAELHGRKILEKLIGLNMFGANRFSADRLDEASEWLDKHFTFMESMDEESVSLDAIFQFIEAKKAAGQVDGVLIDPWNELESTRPEKMTETDFIGLCLKRSRMFARRLDVWFGIVAHPAKMRKDPKTGEYPIPTLYDISGSAHWYNKADNGIVIHRILAENKTLIIVQKVKFKYYGKPGEVEMKYDPYSGRYTELSEHDHFAQPSRQLPASEANNED